MADIIAIRSEILSAKQDDRYVIVDKETGEILDDAQGYGYKTPQKAHAAYAYKTRDKTKDNEKAERRKHIRQWMKDHKPFIRTLEQYACEIEKGSWGPNDKIDTKFVRKMLEEEHLEIDFPVSELLREWRR